MTTEAIKALVPPSKAPKLTALADACNGGACNTGALIRALAAAVEEPVGRVSKHPAVQCIVGHLDFLCGNGIGPSLGALQDYSAWRAL